MLCERKSHNFNINTALSLTFVKENADIYM